MPRTEVSIRIGGAAGDGVASTGEIFAKTMARSGLHVYAYNSYQSVIRGGHVWFQIRAGAEKVPYVGQHADILIALNTQTLEVHLPALREGGAVIFDPKKVKTEGIQFPKGVRVCPMPLLEIAGEFSKNPIMANTVALGAAMGFIGADLDVFAGVIADQFGHKAKEVAEQNNAAAKKGHDAAVQEWGRLHFALPKTGKRRYLLTGNQAIALGALAAGCKFYSFYPMTPATSIGQYLADNGPPLGTVVKQAEDEIAVINMAIGASYAGARSMCGTSGGGFALMTEAMGFAGMVETPLVVVNSMRGGPSTGLPTKTEQGDLFQMLGASQGDYPKAIIAPRNVEEAFYATGRAFNLAEKYQMPVMLASDLLLSEHFETVDGFDFNVPIERGLLWGYNGEGKGSTEAQPASASEGPYLRYALTESGVSPRAFPGTPHAEHIAGSDEHDEDGTLLSDVRAGLPDAIELRNKMMQKRGAKVEGCRREMAAPELHGPKDAPITLVSWGSTQGAVHEAIDMLKKDGIAINSLEFRDIHPLNRDATMKALKAAKYTVMVEGNYTGQLENYLRMELCYTANDHLRKYDGEPFWPEDIVKKVKEIMTHKKIPQAGVA